MSFTRRDILVGLLGASVGSACKKTPPPVRFDGDFIRKSSAAVGHRIRDAKTTSRAPKGASVEEVPVVVLGAGMAGLTAAWWLARSGLENFQVLELEHEPGGTSFSGGPSGDKAQRYPWGAHYLPAPTLDQPELVEFLETIGACTGRTKDGQPIYDERQLCASPKERVFYRGYWYPGLYPKVGASRGELDQLKRFQHEVDRFVARRGKDGRRAFTLPVSRCSDDPELRALDELSMAAWMKRKGFDAPRLSWMVDHNCRDDYGIGSDQTSAWAGIHYFASRVAEAGSESAEFLTWPSGNGHLVDAMVERVGPTRIRLGRVVVAVEPDGDGRRARVTTWDRDSEKLKTIVAERVIYALPSFTRRYLIRGFEAPAYHPNYAPWLVANLHLADHPKYYGYEESWDNVVYGSKSLGYVVSTHQTLASRGPTVWTYYLPFGDGDAKREREKLLSLSYKDASDAVVHELSSCHVDFERQVRRVDLLKWGHGLVRPDVGSVFADARKSAADPVGPIHFAHTDLSQISLFEEAFFHGTRAAKEVLKEVAT